MRRKIIEIDEELCNGCGRCVIDCSENAIAIIDGKARVVADRFCDGLGACLATCPQNALRIVEREADPFDAAAAAAAAGVQTAEACASSDTRCSRPSVSLDNVRMSFTGWPFKLRLMSPSTVFPGGQLLVVADCAPASSPGFHGFVGRRPLCIACPKFEDNDFLRKRLVEILRSNPGLEISPVRIDVPCCRSLSTLCAEALREVGFLEPIAETILSRYGCPLDPREDY